MDGSGTIDKHELKAALSSFGTLLFVVVNIPHLSLMISVYHSKYLILSFTHASIVDRFYLIMQNILILFVSNLLIIDFQ